MGFLGNPDDQLLNVFACIPEHELAARIGVQIAGAVDRFDRPGSIAIASFQF